MSRYNVYPLGLSAMTKAMYQTKHDRNKHGIAGTLKQMGKLDMITTMMCADFSGHVYSEEYFWLRSGKHIIFPDSKETLEKLQRGKFRVELAKGIRVPHESFVLAMPSDFTLAGFDCPSLLVTAIPAINRFDRLFVPFLKATGTPVEKFGKPEHDHDFFLAINYSLKKDMGAVSRICLPWEKLPDVLRCKNGQEYHNVIGSFDKIKDIPLAFDIPDSEQELQFQIVNLLARMFVYIQASDESLVEGFPSDKSFKDVPQILSTMSTGKPAAQTFSLSSQEHKNRPVTAHYRSFCIRQLRDEKYYQGEWQNYERGSRFVFVRDTYVGADVSAETLIG